MMAADESRVGTDRSGTARHALRHAACGPPICVVITGASSGLGAGLAQSYAAPGRVLGLIGRNAERLAAIGEVCRGAGATVRLGVLDVGDSGALGAWLNELDAAAPVDLLIANAGVSSGTRPGGALEGAAAAFAVVQTNLLGVLHSVEALLPAMLARGRGQIAVVASVAAYRGLPDSPAYCASKAGVLAYGEALRAALAPRGIRVSVIVPGFFASPMSSRYIGNKMFMVSGADAVALVRGGLDRRARRIVFPRRLAWLLRVADLLPAWLGDRIMRVGGFRILPEGGVPGGGVPGARAEGSGETGAPP
jgi:short-subunit dehydrogenase